MRMTVAQLLKYKKRFVGRLATITADITKNNSRLADSEQEVNVAEAIEKRQRMVAHLIEVKTVLYLVNQKIQKEIFTMAEKKSEIAMYQGLSTQHGRTAPSYGGRDGYTYVATVRKADVDAKVAQLTKDIDALQEHLDGFNHNTKVEVPDFNE